MGASAFLPRDALGCAGKSLGPVSAETLIGRWRALTKGDADEGNATRDARTPTPPDYTRLKYSSDATIAPSTTSSRTPIWSCPTKALSPLASEWRCKNLP